MTDGSARDIFIKLFGEPADVLAARLISRAALSNGFEAQELGRQEMSSASSGIILYSAASLPNVSDEVLAPSLLQFEQWIRADGSVRAHDVSRDDGETSWADAQILLALCRRPHLIKSRASVARLAQRLLALQQNGTWSLRADLHDFHHPLFTMYPMFSLLAARRASLVEEAPLVASLAAAARYLLDFVRRSHEPAASLLVTACLHAIPAHYEIVPRDLLMKVRRITEKRAIRQGVLKIYPVVVPVESQPLWHATINVPLLYLCTRRVWKPLSPLPVALADRLLATYSATTEGWRNDTKSGPCYSWTTALGIFAGNLLSRDLAANGWTVEGWRRQVRKVRDMNAKYKYDVVISFSGRQRAIAERIFNRLTEAGFVVFYDRDREHELLGEDLAVCLQKTYFLSSRFAIAVLSKEFVGSKWAGNWEWRAILARMQSESTTYLLPYFLEDVEVPGLNPTIGYLAASTHSPEEFADAVIEKLSASAGPPVERPRRRQQAGRAQ